jgi:branched-chain amino acid transport system permease protein
MTTTVERTEAIEPVEPPASGGARYRPTPAGWASRVVFVLALAALSVYYVLHWAPVHSDILAGGVIIAIGALSLNVLIGYAGQISLGQQAFIGIGAFTSAYVISQSGQSFYVGVAAAAVVGVVQAVVLGLIALRVRGLYFALVTLVWGFVAENCIFRLKGFTNGGAGQNAPRPGGFTTDRAYLLLCVIFLAVILMIDWRLVATKAGRAMQALRESPQVAASFGINVKGYLLLSFGVAGFYAGVAGALFASRRTNVVAEDFQFAQIALPYLIVAVVGGLRRRGGIVLFSILFVLSDDWLPDLARALNITYIQQRAGLFVQALSGVLAIVTLIFQPDGLGTITAPIGRWLKGDRFELDEHGGPGAEVTSGRP